ncbi:hypothetical protein B296_00039501 [Ensete ventricosum]|uniref:Uncharacterized protein n=1 Tax=Ensete ventricosum TaxID=4639 RepID=A0A426YRW2_ENSVE|nr:hypothetical protein B296_00039501 [Ensete ventricosum]
MHLRRIHSTLSSTEQEIQRKLNLFLWTQLDWSNHTKLGMREAGEDELIIGAVRAWVVEAAEFELVLRWKKKKKKKKNKKKKRRLWHPSTASSGPSVVAHRPRHSEPPLARRQSTFVEHPQVFALSPRAKMMALVDGRRSTYVFRGFRLTNDVRWQNSASNCRLCWGRT